MARILVADDDDSVRAAIRKVLVTAGHTVDEAGDGQAVLDMYRSNPSDLLLIDLYMPRMDGLEAIIRLRAEQPDIKIVALSGGGYRNKHDVLTMAIEAGARHTLAKPFERADLVAAVSDALGTEHARQPAKATVLLVDDDERTRSVLRQRLEAAGHAVIEAPDAETALQRFRGQPVDVVLTDLILPGQSGAELITTLRSEVPTVGIVAISGAPERLAALSDEFAGWAGFRTLPKPFTTLQLLEAIDAALPTNQPPRPLRSGLWSILGFLRRRKSRQD